MTYSEAENSLKAADPNEPVIQAFLKMLNTFTREECLHALDPNLSSNERAYNCGRGASLTEFEDCMIQSTANRSPD